MFHPAVITEHPPDQIPGSITVSYITDYWRMMPEVISGLGKLVFLPIIFSGTGDQNPQNYV